MPKKATGLTMKSVDIIKSEGMAGFVRMAGRKIIHKLDLDEKYRANQNCMCDVLFIVGSHLPQVKRYRVDHQAEQLRASGLTADIISDDKLTMEHLKYYRGFVFCRYPHTEFVEEFIKAAKSFNKTVVFEIDDLVFDTYFTDNIQTVQNMNKEDRNLYDSGVKRHQQTLKLCDYAVTTTKPLADELIKYRNIKDVYINRNVASDAMVAVSLKAKQAVERNSDAVTIGYFSGSITHNEDFEMVLPALVKLMKRHEDIRLHIVGILDEQSELLQFGDRVHTIDFIDWQKLPEEIRKCDINLAPLAQKTIFNESKSEIKWLEAALVETVTVASDFGAYKTEVKNGVNGVLVKNDEDWFEELEALVADADLRQRIASNAFNDAVEHRTTIATGKKFADWFQKIFAKNVAFAIPSSAISGGVNVVLKHADILRENGFDVTIINCVGRKDKAANTRNLDNYNEVFAYETVIDQRVDEMVATLWATVPYVREKPTVKVKSYFVQSFETDFLNPGDANRLVANSTYCYDDLKYMTMSLWCKDWLKNTYGQDALYASNGLWSERYTFKKRDFSGRKVRILIEGDPNSKWKNVDEAFKIANQLDKNKFEINFLSYYADPKDWYQVDNFYHKIPSEEVGKVYESNDILLKTSLLESFSYPPLEMMATGGYVVVIPNGGNLEYLKDGENCLMFDSGDEKKALLQIERIVQDSNLRDRLNQNGKKLAVSYGWHAVEKQVLDLYK